MSALLYRDMRPLLIAILICGPLTLAFPQGDQGVSGQDVLRGAQNIGGNYNVDSGSINEDLIDEIFGGAEPKPNNINSGSNYKPPKQTVWSIFMSFMEWSSSYIDHNRLIPRVKSVWTTKLTATNACPTTNVMTWEKSSPTEVRV